MCVVGVLCSGCVVWRVCCVVGVVGVLCGGCLLPAKGFKAPKNG